MGFHYSVYYISIEQEVAYFPFENHIESIVSSGVIMSKYLVPVSSQNCKGLRHCTSHMPANPVLASETEFAGGWVFSVSPPQRWLETMFMGWTRGSVTEWLQRKPARIPYPVLVSQAGKLAMERGWAINVGECPAAWPGHWEGPEEPGETA